MVALLRMLIASTLVAVAFTLPALPAHAEEAAEDEESILAAPLRTAGIALIAVGGTAAALGVLDVVAAAGLLITGVVVAEAAGYRTYANINGRQTELPGGVGMGLLMAIPTGGLALLGVAISVVGGLVIAAGVASLRML